MINDNVKKIIQESLTEDIPTKDITTHYIDNNSTQQTAKIIAKEPGIFCGEEIIQTLWNTIDENAKITLFNKDGDTIHPQDTVCEITAAADTILKIERTLLNFLQHLCGISTITHKFIKKLNNPNIKILDTRKTTPTLRYLEKHAVKTGGGHNHRANLSDAVLIKENHLTLFFKSHSIDQLPHLFKTYKSHHPSAFLEIEIESIKQLETYDLSLVDFILLDNFKLELLNEAIIICRKRFPKTEIEISGNVSLETIQNYSKLDIDRISIGSLTHSVKAFDLSLLIQ